MQPDRCYRRQDLLPSIPAGACGVDEAGRGPLAGPVMAAAVMVTDQDLSWVRDSKQVSPAQRMRWADRIRQEMPYAVASASAEEVDRLNIFQATLLAMRRAVNALSVMPSGLWVDGLHAPSMDLPTCAVVQGDQRMGIISAASILAKVARDEYMVQLASTFPEYGFERHKGYGSAFHLDALRRHGPCAEHRRSFEPLKSALR